MAPCSCTAQSLQGTLEGRLGADPAGERRQEAVEKIIQRSVEKDQQPAGWILTALKWINPGVGPRVAADGSWCYLYLHLICTREMPHVSGESREPFHNNVAAQRNKPL